MSESLDSRKFERKPVFDVPLPMRRAQKDTSTAGDESPTEGASTPPNPNTMAFSLMTKKGNKQQVRVFANSLLQKRLLNHETDPIHRITVGLSLRDRREI